MSIDIRNCVLKTLCYSDIFDYPLTEKQIWNFLISSEKVNKKNFDKVLITSSLRSGLAGEAISANKDRHSRLGGLAMTGKNSFYFLPNRSEIINKRLRHENYSFDKFKIAKKISNILSIIPSIQFIGISGGLAMNNCDENDDIDFFIIAQKKSVWVTRLFCLLVLQVLGKRRKRGDKRVKNKICINMIIDESVLKMPKDRQNLYTAHEVIQMKPIINRENTYQKFIAANRWAEEYLPNALGQEITLSCFLPLYQRGRIKVGDFFGVVLRLFLRFSALEYLSKKIQLYFIKKHQTIETVDDHFLAFHPIDYGDIVMKEYNKRLKKYNIND